MKTVNKVAGYLKNPHILFLLFLTILANILVLSNILQSDYFGDDLYNFQTPGKVPHDYVSITSYALEAIKGWMSIGRFFPISASYMFYLYDWFDTLFSYKLLMLTFIVTSNILFSYFVYIFSKRNFHIALLVLGLTPVLFQYKLYHDPILSFHGLMPLLFSFLVISLIFLLKYIDKNQKFYLGISLLFFALCLATYEIAYTFILIYMLIIFSRSPFKTFSRANLITLSLFIGMVLIFAMYTIYLRSLFEMPVTNNPYLPNWNIFAILKTYFLQTVSVLPTLYFFNFGRFPEIHHLGKGYIFISALMAYIFLFSFQYKEKSFTNLKSIFILSMLLLFLPGLLISLSTKFQGYLGDMNRVQFGLPYLPVYIQTFGLSLLLSIMISSVSKTKNIIFILIGLGFIFTVHTVSNNQVISSVNTPHKDTRESLTAFFSGDFNNRLTDGDLILIDGDSLFHSKEFISLVTKKNITVSREEVKDYHYKLSYEISTKDATFNVYDNKLNKNFLIMYKKIGRNWIQEYNEYLGSAQDIINIPPFFINFYSWEGDAGELRWATSNPAILWINPTNDTLDKKLFFEIKSLNSRDLKITLNDINIVELFLDEGKRYEINETVGLQPGRNYINFLTEEPAVDPPGEDNRKLLFSIEKMHPFYTLEE